MGWGCVPFIKNKIIKSNSVEEAAEMEDIWKPMGKETQE